MNLRSWLWVGCLIATLCIGCMGGGTSSVYYTLQPVHEVAHPSEAAEASRLVIGLGPVNLPEYLDRSAIVTRITANRLEINDGHRWAGSLQSEIMRVLADDLGSRLQAKEVMPFPWRSMVDPDMRFKVDIHRFEGGLGDHVTLKAAWSLIAAHSNQVTVRRVSLFKEKADGNDFEDLAAAMGRALARLSGEMAEAVKITVSSRSP